ncbi:MAG: hypothetical protein H0W72_13695 [Planctomycetes bacterium]|nr:hypothetical protein [Planctomycetota bacterium]
MAGPEPDERDPADLVQALGAIARLQSLWLADLDQVCRGDPAFVAAFRRWEEQLTALKLYIHRAEARLLHYLLAAPTKPWREYGGTGADRDAATERWTARLLPYFATLRLETTYRRIGSVLELDEDPSTADIITDLIALAEVAETTQIALAGLERGGDPAALQDLAFYHVIAPWRRAQAPLLDVLRWLAEAVREHADL